MMDVNSIDAAQERAAFALQVEAAGDAVLAICETCPARRFANMRALRLGGWIINRQEAFCPTCGESV